jgi:hypothetical protein
MRLHAPYHPYQRALSELSTPCVTAAHTTRATDMVMLNVAECFTSPTSQTRPQLERAAA